MFNLGKKQSFQPKKLTEQEIQKKLYGEFGIGSKEVGSPIKNYEKAAPARPQVEPQQPAASSGLSVKFEDEPKNSHEDQLRRPVSSDLFSSDFTVQPDAEIRENESDESFDDEDLFDETEADLQKEEKSEYPVKSVDLGAVRMPEKKPQEPVRFNKPASFNPVKTAPSVEQKRFNLNTERSKPKTDWKKLYREYDEKWNNVTSVFRDIFRRAFSFFDFKNEYVRQVLYWLTGFAILILLLVGIHSLNVERENAILASKNTSSSKAQAVKKAVSDEAGAATSGEQATSASSELTLTPSDESKQTTVQSQETAVESTPASEGKFVIQVATYVTEEDAEKVRKEITAAGWSSFVKGLSRSSTGRVYYSAFIGRYPSYKEAQKANAQFQKSEISKPFKDAFIRTLD